MRLKSAAVRAKAIVRWGIEPRKCCAKKLTTTGGTDRRERSLVSIFGDMNCLADHAVRAIKTKQIQTAKSQLRALPTDVDEAPQTNSSSTRHEL